MNRLIKDTHWHLVVFNGHEHKKICSEQALSKKAKRMVRCKDISHVDCEKCLTNISEQAQAV